MYIANPIYDVVFKYLMEDAKVAKLLLSSILETEIKSLNFLPQEFTGEFEGKIGKQLHKQRLGLTVYRIDFSAKIKTPEGDKQVIIELQKAKFPTDIMRFRKYLGNQFINKENTQRVFINGRSRKVGLPIISIYFLGHKLDYTQASAVKVQHICTDMITGEVIAKKEPFIESLTVESRIIQIPYLKDKRRNELEQLLSVFDQSNAVDVEHHVLNMNENEFPQKFQPIIRKLHQAVQSPEMKQKMEMEDGILDELEYMEREIEDLSQKKAKAEAEILKKEEERLKAEEEKVQEKEERLKAEEAKEREKEERLKAEAENERLRKQIEELLKNTK